MYNVKGTMLMLVLACSVSAMAQTATSETSTKNDKMGKQTSITGCIAEKDGKYLVTNNSNPNGVTLTSSEDLKPHVGHTVTLTGMMDKMDAMGGDAPKTDDKASNNDMAHASAGMTVSSMKMVSDHCDSTK